MDQQYDMTITESERRVLMTAMTSAPGQFTPAELKLLANLLRRVGLLPSYPWKETE